MVVINLMEAYFPNSLMKYPTVVTERTSTGKSFLYGSLLDCYTNDLLLYSGKGMGKWFCRVRCVLD